MIRNNESTILPAFEKSARSYQSWNTLTAECYRNKLKCESCPNQLNCQIAVMHLNPYKIQNIKYAVLMTYANIGTKGINAYFTKLAKN